jgi:hypothetical protein
VTKKDDKNKKTKEPISNGLDGSSEKKEMVGREKKKKDTEAASIMVTMSQNFLDRNKLECWTMKSILKQVEHPMV